VTIEVEDNKSKKKKLDISMENGFLLSEDDDEAKKKQMSKNAKRRFGHIVKFDKYKTSNLIKIICIILAIIIIPLEIFLESVL
jgi:hypothetical protein